MERLGKVSVLLFLLCCMVGGSLGAFNSTHASSGDDGWVHVTSVPTNANASIGIIPTFGYIWAVALNEELYCYGGINQHEQSGYVWFGVNEKYNLKTGTWTKVTPPAQGSIAVVACQNKIYSIGAQTQVYDPSTDTWINKTAMPKTLLKTNANVVDNKIYVISGAEYASLAGVYSSEATYQYDPETDSWSTLASIPTPVEGYASAVLDGKIYIIGGAAMSQNYSNQVVNLVQVFNPKTNHWTTGKPLPTGVYAAGACATTGVNAAAKIYVVGGHTHYVSWVTSAILSPHGTTLNQIFDPATGEWSLGASLPQPRWQCTLINVNDTLIIVGGENGPADSSLFDNPEKIVLDIERYVPTGYQDILPSAVPQDTSGSLQPENTNYLYLTIAPAIILAITFTALLIFRSKRKTRFPSSFKR